MRFERTASFLADYRRMSVRERALFRVAVRDINEAYESRGDAPLPRWPGRLRVRDVEGAPGIWEMTWSFAGPDGRATFEYVDVAGEVAIRWRRIGGHEIFHEP
jgi:hypothetical protein